MTDPDAGDADDETAVRGSDSEAEAVRWELEFGLFQAPPDEPAP